MRLFKSKDIHLSALNKGENLHEQLEGLAIELNLSGAWMNGIGASSSLTLGFYDPETKDYEWKEFNEPLEIVSLQGNLSVVDGKPFWHIHGTFGRRDLTTISGHVKSCTIGLSCEIAVMQIDINITRKYDEETGLNLLQ